MIENFNEKDLVSFGTYLLSKERRNRFVESYKDAIRRGAENPISVEDSLSHVHQSDIDNWKSSPERCRSILLNIFRGKLFSKADAEVLLGIPTERFKIFVEQNIPSTIINAIITALTKNINKNTNNMNNTTIIEQDIAILKNMAVNTVRPLPEMEKYILKGYNVSEGVAKVWAKDILEQVGADLGFQTRFSTNKC